MDERTQKRLLIIVAASIAAIMLIKVVLTKTYTALNKAADEKKQAAIAKHPTPIQTSAAPTTTTKTDVPPASPSLEEAIPAGSSAASSVTETR